MYQRRRLIIGGYNTAEHGPWTLTGLSFPEPDRQENLVTVPGRQDGPLDMSTVLTGGEPIYGNRTLTATLECSEGTRMDREALIGYMVNQLDGRQLDIILPDDPTRYISGRVSVKKEYNDLAHAAVTVTAKCSPWRYNLQETVLTWTASAVPLLTVLPNAGRRIALPQVNISGANASVTLRTDQHTWTLGPGAYTLPELRLPPGNLALYVSGMGTVEIKYREAVL